ncbi:UNVERIFIED_ORG: excisionase family DNA binding protein [Rhizobium esperanzae]
MTADDIAVLKQMLARIEGKLDRALDLRESSENAMDAEPAGPELEAADDFAAENLIDAGTAAQRAGVSKQTIRRWVTDHSIGFKRGGRLLVSIPRLRRHTGDDAL